MWTGICIGTMKLISMFLELLGVKMSKNDTQCLYYAKLGEDAAKLFRTD
jgi:hypothetical protein